MSVRSLKRKYCSRYAILIVVCLFLVFYLNATVRNNVENSLDEGPEKAPLVDEAPTAPTPRPRQVIRTEEIEKDRDWVLHKKEENKNQELEEMILRDLAKQVPGFGVNGKGVVLEGSAKELGEKQLAAIALNEEASEHISYNRTIPDTRHPACARKVYDMKQLAKSPASVVVIFFNEPYSVILRTIYSILNTADERLLKEIILVDDASTNEELLDKFGYYVKTRLPKKVKLIRSKTRGGLIQARSVGAREATGEVLVFLDSHCECSKHWLEPIIERIQESRTSVLVPIIESISPDTFAYSGGDVNYFQVGGFSWSGHFTWIPIPDRERERQKRECKEEVPAICPTYSPSMAGGLLAVERQYFWDLGGYDELMEGWGGENLEISFRTWQCGGSVETIPCSRIGHVFRKFHHYKIPDDKDTHGINTLRMAKVWMDDYIQLFYSKRTEYKVKPPNIGDLSSRIKIRKDLKCHSFDWYMENVFPEKFVPFKNVQYYGKVKSMKENLCFDDMQQPLGSRFNMGAYPCHSTGGLVAGPQLVALTHEGVLRTETSCANVNKNGDTKFVMMVPCENRPTNAEDKWDLTEDGHLKNLNTGLCVDHALLDVKKFLSGLIQARLVGARLATGGVLVFLDAHCECVETWLEPLIQRIQESRTSVLVPIIETISPKTFSYIPLGANDFRVGSFNWNGHFNWMRVPDRELRRLERECNEDNISICPTNSPTMAGGLLAIDRQYFWEIGSYDEQMDGWGGENLEMSFRIWQCGGTIETIPCSRIGHIFRDFHHYKMPNNKDTHGINTLRMAKVWMDEYAELFLSKRVDFIKTPPEIGDLTERIKLRETLQCRNFSWYIENVFPEKFIPTKNVKFYGKIRATNKNLCLDDMQQKPTYAFKLGAFLCHTENDSISSSQILALTNSGVLRTEHSCATLGYGNSHIKYVLMEPCFSDMDITDRWNLTMTGQLKHKETGMCLDHGSVETLKFVGLNECDVESKTQTWKLEK